MNYPQLVVYEGEQRLAVLLRPLADAKRWVIQEPKQFNHCLQVLEREGPRTLVVKLGRDLEREFTLLERVCWLNPEVPVIAVGDAIHEPLHSLIWDLGASYVLMPPQPRELLTEIVSGFMTDRSEATA